MNKQLTIITFVAMILMGASGCASTELNEEDVQDVVDFWASDRGQNSILERGWMTPSRTTPDSLSNDDWDYLMTHALPVALRDCGVFYYRIASADEKTFYFFVRPKRADNPTCETVVLQAPDSLMTNLEATYACDFTKDIHQPQLRVGPEFVVQWTNADNNGPMDEWIADHCDVTSTSSGDRRAGLPVGSGCHTGGGASIDCGDSGQCVPYPLDGDKTARIGICASADDTTQHP